MAKKKKSCGHGKHYWKTTCKLDKKSKRVVEVIKCIHCGEIGQLNLEMN